MRKVKGPHTGDIAAEMLKDAGASAVILGHSERRIEHGETDDLDKGEDPDRAGRRAVSPLSASVRAWHERQEGRTLDVITKQIFGSLPPNASPQQTIVAYEPVWAIGTGLTPSPRENRRRSSPHSLDARQAF